MSSEWRTVPIESLCLGIYDGPHATPKKTQSGPIFLGISSLNNGQLDLSATEHLSEVDFLKWTRRVTPTAGDIVFSYETRLGQVAAIPTGLRCCLGRRMALMRVDPEKVTSDYLLYAYLSPGFQEVIRQRTIHGSTVDRIPLVEFGSFPIAVPSLQIQKDVVSVLRALDDRITLLRETNATLESIAQALFKSWFIDFDPVRSKMEGRAPEGMDEATAALFPDSFEETELGLVPRGWQIGNFSDAATVASGKRPASRSDKKTESNFVPLYGGAGLMGYTSESLFDSPRILTGRVGTLGKVNVAYPPFWASDNVLIVSPKSEALHSFVLNWLKEIDVHALNRGSTQPLLTQRDLGAQIGVMPPMEVLEAYEKNVSAMYESIREAELRIATLTDLRDTLLPRLISGQLRLPEVNKIA